MNTSLEWIKDNDNTYYTWDATIGKYGGFYHKNSNNELTTEEITLNNIGDIYQMIIFCTLFFKYILIIFIIILC